MGHRISYYVMMGCYILCIALAMFGIIAEVNWALYAAPVPLVLGICQALLFCRCPNCKRILTTGGKRPSHCSGCKMPVEW